MEVRDNAPFLDLPNGAHQEIRGPIHYGKTPVPHPVNNAAKVVHDKEVMRAVLQGK